MTIERPDGRAGLPEQQPVGPDLAKRLRSGSQTVYNLRQTIIVIGRDRLTLILTRNRSKLIRVELVLSLVGLFLSALLALVTSDFKTRWGISPSQWSGLFFVVTVVAGIWLAFELVRLVWRRLTIESLVDKIERESDRPLG